MTLGRLPLVLFCGGGSGGHLTLGLAVADALAASPGPPELRFLTGERPVELRMMGAEPYSHETFPLAPLGGTVRSRAFAGGFGCCFATARRLAAGRACVAVGTGGYVSVPGVLGARAGGATAVLIEPNAVDGRATRALAPLAARVFRTTPNRKRGLPGEVSVEPRSLFVMGGSAGSSALDAAVPAVVAGLADAGTLRVRHQCGGDVDAVRAAYLAAGTRPERLEVAPFFPQAAVRMAEAAVSITRAGALTLAEAAGYGVRPILVPYPGAAGHQLANARRHAAIQGGAVVEEGPDLPGRLRAALVEELAAPPPVRRLTATDPAAELAERISHELRRLRG
ncbi:UDP-N-acetylglucosamine--N-acetylmuramyl-(pentapeptide) pyrophosphoryl-undecaprenol N-acetylglucosamine transferase [Alienimonas sp. DA493]|uniref:UDP-N-acetylglucosamine--N-acetylmuramyl- (pentapeptide) pyrophosphoryl-undecaprenol N-acetylglucosamine transferase n=1 Tax=Alienimonas sp. DA493 TaxID=3373605 RepID=UPI003754E445